MTEIQRIAFVGNALPRRCGIATFTTDLRNAVASVRPDLQASIIAMTDNGRAYDYPAMVSLEIADQTLEDYAHAADVLNDERYDVVSLQHEFGIFGGEAGDHVLTLLNRLSMPVVTTLHTVLSQPSAAQRSVMDRIIEISSRLLVMAEKGRDLLQRSTTCPPRRSRGSRTASPTLTSPSRERRPKVRMTDRFGLGKAVVSTPYWHAAELLADGRGIFVPFADAQAIATEIAGLLTDDVKRNAMRRRAFASSRSMTGTALRSATSRRSIRPVATRSSGF